MLPFLASMVITTTGSALFVSRTGHYWGVLVVGPVYAVAPNVHCLTQYTVTRFCCIAGGLLFTVSELTSPIQLIIYQILYGIGVGALSRAFIHYHDPGA